MPSAPSEPLSRSGEAGRDRPITVVVADDHGLFRRGLRELLEERGVVVLAEAGTGRAAVSLVAALAPDVVVMDLHMPIMSGVEATRRIMATAPATRVLILTVSASEDDVVDAILAGAAGYLLKDASAAQIVAGIRAAIAGDAMISPAVATRMLARLRGHEQRRRQAEVARTGLTDRELEVLGLVAEGCDNVEIGARLFISATTVKHHVSSVLHKLGIENRVQAAVYAARHGLA
jgi:DNA-binding NarL/FixJ family response regulator